MDNKILLFSSGLDSTIAWAFLGKPQCLHITQHSRYSWKERQAIEKLKTINPELQVTVKTLSFLREFEEPDANLPARNLYFVSVAAHFGDEIFLVCQRGEMEIPDRSPQFFEKASDILSFLHGKPKVVSPVFQDLTKPDMVGQALKNGVPEEMLLSTYSCFSSKPGRCGACPACARTAWALDYNNVSIPPDFFNADIWKWEGWRGYVQRIKEGKYEFRRSSQMKETLTKQGLWY